MRRFNFWHFHLLCISQYRKGLPLARGPLRCGARFGLIGQIGLKPALPKGAFTDTRHAIIIFRTLFVLFYCSPITRNLRNPSTLTYIIILVASSRVVLSRVGKRALTAAVPASVTTAPHSRQYSLWCNKGKKNSFHDAITIDDLMNKLVKTNALLNYCSWESALLISCDLFKNVFCITWQINDNFELEALLLR